MRSTLLVTVGDGLRMPQSQAVAGVSQAGGSDSRNRCGGHLGELTQLVPFEMVDDALVRTGRLQCRVRLLPAGVVACGVS
jgi:hypothetical protein